MNKLVEEMICATNLSFSLYPGLTHGATTALMGHGSEDLTSFYLPKMISGEWSGTMCLTEAHCGTDLGLLRTRAEPQEDGSYAITGGKIFISAGDHDLTDNVIHVLMPAWTMEGVGRMALVSDPLGAPFYIMASEDERPSRAFAEHGTAPAIGHVVWNERIASDPDRALGFFGRHFGWTQQGGMPVGELGEYRFLADGPVMLGALMGVPPGEQPGWRFYFAVDDIDAAAARIREAGGGIEMEPMEIPGGEYSLSARDPQGARFGLVGPRR